MIKYHTLLRKKIKSYFCYVVFLVCICSQFWLWLTRSFRAMCYVGSKAPSHQLNSKLLTLFSGYCLDGYFNVIIFIHVKLGDPFDLRVTRWFKNSSSVRGDGGSVWCKGVVEVVVVVVIVWKSGGKRGGRKAQAWSKKWFIPQQSMSHFLSL
jgi:hypothetical protein